LIIIFHKNTIFYPYFQIVNQKWMVAHTLPDNNIFCGIVDKNNLIIMFAF